jgi:outer membrane protein TolC
MMKITKNIFIAVTASCILYTGCKVPALVQAPQPKAVAPAYANSTDTTNSATVQWRSFFADQYLVSLIDTALVNNQELSITLQEIEIARNEIRSKQGLLLPRVEAGGGIGVEKAARYTSQGAGDASTEITPGKEVPEWLPDYRLGAYATWELDVWKKLRNSKKAALDRYLATVEGRNFVITNLVAEIANAYYELLALDNQLDIVKRTIKLQQNALEIVKIQKLAARATELGVKKFEAEVFGSQSLEFDIQQKITAKENEINYLLGRYPQPIARDTTGFLNLTP